MSADQIAEIAPFIREVLGAPPESNLCATFEVTGNSAAWVQVTATNINAAYPCDEKPELRLASFLSRQPCTGLSDWQPMQFVTFTYEAARPAVVARFVDELLTDLFSLGDYFVDAQLVEL